MTEYSGQTYGPGTTVDLDGNVFTKCVFERCRMRFAGGPVPTFADCRLNGVVWAFTGPAANAMTFLSALYNHFGEPGRRDAEEMIKNIKSGTRRTS